MQNYTIDETAKIIHLGKTRIYKELNSGRLKAVKAGTRTLIPQVSIEEWLSKLPAYPIKQTSKKKITKVAK